MSRPGRIALAAFVVVAVLAGGWMGLVRKRQAAMAVEAQIAQAKTRQAGAVAAITHATRARAQARRDDATVARLSKAVPNDDDVGTLIRQLDVIARANDIDFRSAALSGDAAVAPAATEAAEGGKDAPAGDNAATTEAAGGESREAAPDEDGGPPVAATVVQPPPGAAVGHAGLLTVPFSFTFDGGYLALQRFLGAIDAQAQNDKGRISVRGRLITVDGSRWPRAATDSRSCGRS